MAVGTKNSIKIYGPAIWFGVRDLREEHLFYKCNGSFSREELKTFSAAHLWVPGT
jgi:hypothetical protein